MCLLLLAHRAVPGIGWLLLGNRDEFHARPTADAQHWTQSPAVVGGRDLEAGGSWLAVNRSGRFAAVTNVRSGAPRRGVRSRGDLVARFAGGDQPAQAYAAAVAEQRSEYGPFNLLVGDRSAAFGASSVLPTPWAIAPGVQVLSNGPPSATWPKVRRLEAAFVAIAKNTEMNNAPAQRADDDVSPAEHALLDLLADRAQPDDADLPDTGVGLDVERRLAPIFIGGPLYGTRASTLAYARDDGIVVLVERRFGPDGVRLGETRIVA